MAREYYDPDTGQIWATDDEGNFWLVREANPWERPGGGDSATAGAPSGPSPAGQSAGVQPGMDFYNYLSGLLSPRLEEARLRELQIPTFQESQRQFNEQMAFQRAQQAALQAQQAALQGQQQAGLTGFFNGAPTLARQQYESQLKANPRDYAQYFAFTRPGEPIPTPAFAQQLAGGGQLGQPFGGGIAAGQNFGLQPGQMTPRNMARMLPSEKDAMGSLISAQGENPEDFYGRAAQFFPMGRLAPSPRFRSF